MKLTHAETCDLFIDYYGKSNDMWGIKGIIYAIESDEYWGNGVFENLKDFAVDIHIIARRYSNLLPFKETVEKLKEVYVKKNQDYGDSFKKSLGVFGLVALRVRLFDKAMRLKTLLNSNERAVKDETIEDTVMDFINYCIMGYMELNNMENYNE